MCMKIPRPNFTLKLQGCAKVFRVKLGLYNLGFPYTFLESFIITDHWHVFSFLVTLLVPTLAGLQTNRAGVSYSLSKTCSKPSPHFEGEAKRKRGHCLSLGVLPKQWKIWLPVQSEKRFVMRCSRATLMQPLQSKSVGLIIWGLLAVSYLTLR